jgi:prophage DNA circulation protein
LSAIKDFDPSPPSPYSGNWEDASRADKEGTPRFTTYQAPGGKPIPFIQESFHFSGGQSVDTAEYPFGGYWSNESLNEKTQQLTVEGFMRGANYIAKRNALIQSLRIKTDDDNPGYVDFPFWGRFPVVLIDYKIGEESEKQGQCSVSLTFTRAGVTIAERLAAMPDIEGLFDGAKEALGAAAVDEFVSKVSSNSSTLAQGFLALKMELLNIVGRVQAEKTRLSVLTGEVIGFTNLINQGIRAPRELAAAFLSSVVAIALSIKSIAQTVRETHQDNSRVGGAAAASYLIPGANNEKNALLCLFSASEYTLTITAATVSAQNVKTAMENLYRTAALIAASELLISMDNASYEKTNNYWKLLEKLEASIDQNNPAVHSAIEETRVALSRKLSALELSNEMRRAVRLPLPLLYLSMYLGCDAARLRELNSIADSFVIEGDVVYV